MRKIFCACLIATIAGAGSLAAETIKLKNILEDFASLDYLYQPEPFQTRMFSTHDPMGGNKDWDNFLEKSDQKALLADMAGPGIITRIFCADPDGVIKIFLDNDPAALVSMPARDFFAGKLDPFKTPLVGNDPGSFSYFPIPFAKHARIEIEPVPGGKRDFPFGKFWQVEWLELPQNYEVKSLSLPLSAPENSSLEKLKTFFSGLKKFEPPPGLQHQVFEGNLNGAERKTIVAEMHGPAVVRKMSLQIRPSQPDNLKQLLDSAVLNCYWDGESNPSVSVKVSDFFGNSFNLRSPKILVRRTEGGGESMIPMPFARSARCEIFRPIPLPGKVSMEMWYEPEPSLQSPLRFHAFEREQKLKASPAKNNLNHQDDYLVLRAEGRGRYLGTVLTVFNRYIIWWGEGNESFELDKKLAWVGTGTEDYFDGAYSNFGKNIFTGPLIENSFGKGYSGITVAYKFHLLDPVCFQDRLVFKFEHGRIANDMDNWYRSVAYWYQAEPHYAFSNMPGDQLDLSPKTIASEINKETWRAFPFENKVLFLVLWPLLFAVVLILVFFVIITVWRRKMK
jgi:hypothetical protein